MISLKISFSKLRPFEDDLNFGGLFSYGNAAFDAPSGVLIRQDFPRKNVLKHLYRVLLGGPLQITLIYRRLLISGSLIWPLRCVGLDAMGKGFSLCRGDDVYVSPSNS